MANKHSNLNNRTIPSKLITNIDPTFSTPHYQNNTTDRGIGWIVNSRKLHTQFPGAGIFLVVTCPSQLRCNCRFAQTFVRAPKHVCLGCTRRPLIPIGFEPHAGEIFTIGSD